MLAPSGEPTIDRLDANALAAMPIEALRKRERAVRRRRWSSGRARRPHRPIRAPSRRAPQVADLLEEVEWLAPRLAAVLGIDVEVLPPLRLDDRHTRQVHNPWAPRRSQLTQLHARAAFDALLGCRASFRDDYQRRHVLAVTEADLWPGGSLRYVFGLGSGEIQTGVMSLARLALDVPANAADAAIVRERMSDPDVLERARVRALKIAAHEALHLWDLDHCPVPDDPPAGHPGQALLAAGRNVEDLDALEFAMCPEHARQWAAIRSGSGDRYTHLRP